MKVNGWLFLVIIMTLVLIPGVCAATISTGGGSAVSGSGSGQGNFVSNGVTSSGFSVVNGLSLNEDHWVKDITGKYVEVNAYVPNGAESITYQYSLSPNRDKKTVASQSSLNAKEWLSVTNAKTSIEANAIARNGEGDKANVGLKMDAGSLAGYWNSATATKTQATASMYLTSASLTSTGSIDLISHAENKRLASEYLSYSNGQILRIPVNYGGADFEYKAASLGSTGLQSTATSSNVVITPNLPVNIKNAIMLEPMNYAFTKKAGATDLGTTVFPDLVKKGYATLRYTDAGASIDKFQNLGQYNVVLINSHMNSNSIGLSTTGGQIPSYTTSKNSLVVLAGCDSFDGYPTQSALAKWVSGAYISGGYEGSVGTLWNNDYLSNFFDYLSNGYKPSDAVTEAWSQTKGNIKYSGNDNTYYLPLTLYPTEDLHDDFTL
jgi:hypothetical protein